MKKIDKNESPSSFEEWKAHKQPKNWNELDGNPMPAAKQIEGAKYYSKQELREELLKETYGLCCYCEIELQNNPNVAIVEHVQPKLGTINQHLIFDYSNLSISCKGGEKDPKPKELHCDSCKGSTPIPISIFDSRIEEEVKYSIDGKIVGTTADATKTIEILNLNTKKLNNLRRNTVFGLIFSDVENTILISEKDAMSLYNKIVLNKGHEYYSSVISSLQTIMKTGSNNI